MSTEDKKENTTNPVSDNETEENISVKIESISEEHLRFYNEHAKKDSYNPLESKFNLTGAYCLTVRKTNIIAVMVSVPHTIFIHGLGLMKTVLSTYLLTHSKNRNIKLSQTLVLAAIKEGYTRGINIGYYWISTSTNKTGINTKSWYRPLILKKAKVFEYGTVKGVDYSLPEPKGYSTKLSVVDNFMKIASNKLIKLALSEEELVMLSNAITFLTIFRDDVIVGIVGYRPFPIIKPHLKVHPVQLCYFDSTTGLEADVLNTLFNKLKKEGIVAIHGVLMGGIDRVASELGLALSGDIILDFYGLNHNAKDCSRIATLYI